MKQIFTQMSDVLPGDMLHPPYAGSSWLSVLHTQIVRLIGFDGHEDVIFVALADGIEFAFRPDFKIMVRRPE